MVLAFKAGWAKVKWEQIYDRQIDGALARWSVPEHIQAGAQTR